jgi:DNA-binding transcriptional regulator of glucitol operon
MKKLISEDQKMNSQRQMSGMKTETPPEANKVSTLMGANNRDDNSQAPHVKPYPLDRTDEILSDMYVTVMNMEKIIDNTMVNPAFKKNQAPILEEAKKKLTEINKILVEISTLVDKIG